LPLERRRPELVLADPLGGELPREVVPPVADVAAAGVFPHDALRFRLENEHPRAAYRTEVVAERKTAAERRPPAEERVVVQEREGVALGPTVDREAGRAVGPKRLAPPLLAAARLEPAGQILVDRPGDPQRRPLLQTHRIVIRVRLGQLADEDRESDLERLHRVDRLGLDRQFQRGDVLLPRGDDLERQLGSFDPLAPDGRRRGRHDQPAAPLRRQPIDVLHPVPLDIRDPAVDADRLAEVLRVFGQQCDVEVVEAFEFRRAGVLDVVERDGVLDRLSLVDLRTRQFRQDLRVVGPGRRRAQQQDGRHNRSRQS